jgi:hypothetical protein
MTEREKELYESFVLRLNGKEGKDGKPPFEAFVNASKSLGKMKLSQKLKDELRTMVETKFSKEPKEPSSKKTGEKLSDFVAAQVLPPPPASRTPVYGTIPAAVAAKLSFLREAIENNVNVIHGLNEAKEAEPNVDVSEIQDAINRLNLLNSLHNQEVDLILKTVFPAGAAASPTVNQPQVSPGANGGAPVIPQAPIPPSPPTALATRLPIGFRHQTEPDPKEVEMLKRTEPIYNGPKGNKII